MLTTVPNTDRRPPAVLLTSRESTSSQATKWLNNCRYGRRAAIARSHDNPPETAMDRAKRRAQVYCYTWLSGLTDDDRTPTPGSR